MLTDGLYTNDLLLLGHDGPLLVQWDACGVFHDDVLTADAIRGVVAPVEDPRNRHGRVGADLGRQRSDEAKGGF